MACVIRNGRKYFYISQRDGDKVRKIYVGKGDIGRAAELTMSIRKEKRDQVRDWLRIAAITYAKIDMIDARLALEHAAVLFARSRIRLDARIPRRILRTNIGKIMESQLEESIMPVKDQVTWQALSERASRGDREAAAELIPMLDANPALVARWGDLARVSLNLWMNIAGGGELSKSAMYKHVLELVRSVSRFENDPLEATMAKRIGVLWLQVNYFDSQVALAADRTPAEQKFVAKRQKEAQQLYADAAKALREYQDVLARSQLAIFKEQPTVEQSL